MSKTTTAAPKASGRVSLKTSGGDSSFIFVNSALLEAAIPGSIVAKGKLTAKTPNKFNPEKNDYTLIDGGTTYIVNGSATLAQQLEQEGVMGLKLEIVYHGKAKSSKGKDFHNFEVFTIAS